MGSLISLSIGALEIDWGKNSIGRDHSGLFLPSDRTEADYFYADETVERRPAFVRRLRSVVDRLDLLGYTLADCQELYETLVDTTHDDAAPVVSFDEFARALRNVNVTAVHMPEHEYDYDLGEFAAKAILADPEFTKTHEQFRALDRHQGTFFENLDPRLVLRLLAENAANLDLDVVWRFADVLEGGWIDEEDLRVGASQTDQVLIVTEGSSDRNVLSESLSVVLPHVADFFTFVDMSENYPFTGTGNLVRFCQGLCKIGIQNRVLVVLDNDAAGHDAFDRIRELSLPPRMRVVTLPDLDECRRVHTLGPTGRSHADVNGRAVSIEWFLETDLPGHDAPTVRWTSFVQNRDAYQGELIDKQAYVRHFLSQVGRQNRTWPKLDMLWRYLLRACTEPTAL